jgi:16S rRNA (uracil1498-N3)-methyltransferase
VKGDGEAGGEIRDAVGGTPEAGGRTPEAQGRATPPVFLADTAELDRGSITLTGAEGRHAATVRRLAAGERADVTDGAGTIAECTVTRTGPGVIELAVLTKRTIPAAEPRIVVVQAIPKGDRGELAVEIMTEVGVDEVIAWQAERSVARWRRDRADRGDGQHGHRGDRADRGDRGDGVGRGDRVGRADRAGKALARWQATAREAAKQSRRAWIPEVTGPERTPAVARRVAAAGLAILLDPGAEAAFGSLAMPHQGEIVVIVGPEGGVSPAEADALTGAGAVPARLGPTVLRTSSAGAVAAALALASSDRWA